MLFAFKGILSVSVFVISIEDVVSQPFRLSHFPLVSCLTGYDQSFVKPDLQSVNRKYSGLCTPQANQPVEQRSLIL